jgi:hypothetical protein
VDEAFKVREFLICPTGTADVVPGMDPGWATRLCRFRAPPASAGFVIGQAAGRTYPFPPMGTGLHCPTPMPSNTLESRRQHGQRILWKGTSPPYL